MSINIAFILFNYLMTYRILKVKVVRYNRYVNIACIYREKEAKTISQK